MGDIKSRINELVNDIKQERDELRVKLHLAKLEASDEWQKLEAKVEKLEDKARTLGSATAEAAHDIGAAAKVLGQEIRNGFKTIAKRL